MKTFSKTLTTIALSILFVAGCVNEDPAYKNEGGTTPPGNGDTGYLSLGGMSLHVIADGQIQGDDTAGETTRPASRAGETPATDDYVVSICDASGNERLKKSYADLKTMFEQAEGNRIALPVGNYTMRVRSEEESASPAVEWDYPVYGTAYDFSIRKDTSTDIGEVVCKLQNIKVTMMCSADLAARLTDDTQTTISLGNASVVFRKGEQRAAFFLPRQELNTLDFHLSGKFSDTMEPAEVRKTIADVKAGQWRRIALVISYADKGGIKLDIEVENFVQDEEIVVNGTEGAWEPILTDPTAPTITSPDRDLTQPFQLKASMFDADGRCTEPFGFDLKSPNGIESLTVSFTSDNPELIDALLARLDVQEPSFDLCSVLPGTTLHTELQGFGYPLGDELTGAKNKSFDIARQMPMLYNAPGFEGKHTVAFTLTDKNGLQSEASLRLIVDKAAETPEPPAIVWKGFDIDVQQIVRSGMAIDIDVTAPAGIHSFVVTIDSETLTPLLPTIGLAAEFDLCNIEDAEMAKLLSAPIDDGGLGFPVNEQVRDKTYIPFSITYFVDLLVGIPGEHNFQLRITDGKDQTTVKTIRLLSLPQ